MLDQFKNLEHLGQEVLGMPTTVDCGGGIRVKGREVLYTIAGVVDNVQVLFE